MKTIVVSGASSNVGKTALAGKLCDLLPGSVHVKLGHGRRKEGMSNVFYPAGTPFAEIAGRNERAAFLVIESNGILSEIDPDLAIYLPGRHQKPSARIAREAADLVRGSCGDGAARLVAVRLGIDEATAGEIVRLACDGGNTSTGGEERRK